MKSYLTTGLAVLGIIVLLFLAVRFGGIHAVSSIAGDRDVNQLSAENSDLLDRQAPYFDLPDISGTHVKISDFLGKPLIVVFWATWNEAAADQMHILDQYLSGADVSQSLINVLAIDSQEERSIVDSFLSRGGYKVPVLVDASGAVSEEYRIKSLPTAYFIASDGTIRDVYAGVLSEKMLVDKLEKILH